VIGYLIAKAAAKIVTTALRKVGFAGLVERGGAKKGLAKSDYDAAALLAKVVYYAVMLFVLGYRLRRRRDQPDQRLPGFGHQLPAAGLRRHRAGSTGEPTTRRTPGADCMSR